MNIQRAFDLVDVGKYLAACDDFAAYIVMVAKKTYDKDKYDTRFNDMAAIFRKVAMVNRDNFAKEETWFALKCVDEIIKKYKEEIKEFRFIRDDKIMYKFMALTHSDDHLLIK